MDEEHDVNEGVDSNVVDAEHDVNEDVDSNVVDEEHDVNEGVDRSVIDEEHNFNDEGVDLGSIVASEITSGVEHLVIRQRGGGIGGVLQNSNVVDDEHDVNEGVYSNVMDEEHNVNDEGVDLSTIVASEITSGVEHLVIRQRGGGISGVLQNSNVVDGIPHGDDDKNEEESSVVVIETSVQSSSFSSRKSQRGRMKRKNQSSVTESSVTEINTIIDTNSDPYIYPPSFSSTFQSEEPIMRTFLRSLVKIKLNTNNQSNIKLNDFIGSFGGMLNTNQCTSEMSTAISSMLNIAMFALRYILCSVHISLPKKAQEAFARNLVEKCVENNVPSIEKVWSNADMFLDEDVGNSSDNSFPSVLRVCLSKSYKFLDLISIEDFSKLTSHEELRNKINEQKQCKFKAWKQKTTIPYNDSIIAVSFTVVDKSSQIQSIPCVFRLETDYVGEGEKIGRDAYQLVGVYYRSESTNEVLSLIVARDILEKPFRFLWSTTKGKGEAALSQVKALKLCNDDSSSKVQTRNNKPLIPVTVINKKSNTMQKD